VVIAIGIIPFWVYIEEQAIVEPSAKLMLAPQTDGFVTEIVAKDGQMVAKGDVILRMREESLNAQLKRLEARLASLRARQMQSAVLDIAQFKIDQEAIDLTQANIDDYKRRRANLELRAPMDGRLLAPGLDQLTGVYLKQGQQLGQVSATGNLIARVALQQADYEVIRRSGMFDAIDSAANSPIEVRLAGAVGTVLKGVGVTIFDAAQPELPHAALGQAGGNAIATDPSDRTGRRAMQEQFEARVQLPATDEQYLPGQTATVRFKIDREPLAWNWTRRFWQLVKTHQTDKWI
jgi:putative peptide zinc metalloprotease protein